MILTNFVQIKVRKNHYEHYKQLFPQVNNGDTIDIPTENLHPKSIHIIDCKCDICGTIKSLEYRFYLKNTEKYNLYTCSAKCCKIKREKTNLLKYGYLYHSMDKENFIQKVKESSQKKYGKDFYMQTEEWSKRVEKTNITKYGFKTPLLSDTIKNKIKQTNLLKYGFDVAIKNKTIRDKIKKTNLLKYGVDNPSKSQPVKEKTKCTNIQKYGFEWPNQNQEIYNKIQIGKYKTKKYKDLFYKSSYELDFIKFCEIKNINLRNAPSIKYTYNNTNKIYFPDFFLPEHNLIVEIKSTYTFNKEKELNDLKKKFTEKNNFRFIFIIDKNYDYLLSIIK